jgi:alpha,alpha-trehalose phosphorylase
MNPPPRVPAGLPQHRFPVDHWRLVEREFEGTDLGATETLFAIGNGYIGMRANATEGREAHSHGTFLNGFHETWQIHHPEDAFAFAKTGQTIVNVPDAKLMKLYVDDEPLLIANADLDHYERVLDFRSGISSRDLVWRTPAGKRISVRSERMVSFQHRHLAMMLLEIRLLDEPAPVVVSSQLLNRQDGEDEYHVRSAALGEGLDPRRARRFDHRVLLPRLQRHLDDPRTGGEVVLGYQTANSGMTLACAYQHVIDSGCEYSAETVVTSDLAKTVFTIEGTPGQTIRILKLVSYHSSTGVRGARRSATARWHGRARRAANWSRQRAWLETLGPLRRRDPRRRCGPAGDPVEPVPAAARRPPGRGHRDPRQGVTGAGLRGPLLLGHRGLRPAVPDLHRTADHPQPAALPPLDADRPRERAAELTERGALFPWRTINGEEASSYYAAGTAQYHINADIAYAIKRYVDVRGDRDLLAEVGAEILVETARLWEDLGFYSPQRRPARSTSTGSPDPDEYTTVVNDNAFTNLMARRNLRYAAEVVPVDARGGPDAYARLCTRPGSTTTRSTPGSGRRTRCTCPTTRSAASTRRTRTSSRRRSGTSRARRPTTTRCCCTTTRWSSTATRCSSRPTWSSRWCCSTRVRRGSRSGANFEYYDPLTTGDSSLSACVQAILAAEIGHHEMAFDYFRRALYLDLLDLHGNTDDGVHIASSGGVWAGLVYGFAGLHDNGECLRFTPRLPACWEGFSFRLVRHGSTIRVDVDRDGCTATVEAGNGIPLQLPEELVFVAPGESVRFPRDVH